MTETDPSALLPCPSVICGYAEPSVRHYSHGFDVECPNCNASTTEGRFKTEAEAIAAWNRRTPVAPEPDVRRLKRAIQEVLARWPRSIDQEAECVIVEELVDAVAECRAPVAITDEMVEAALRASWEKFAKVPWWNQYEHEGMRAALTAALSLQPQASAREKSNG